LGHQDAHETELVSLYGDLRFFGLQSPGLNLEG
jgi:hypothetical protein